MGSVDWHGAMDMEVVGLEPALDKDGIGYVWKRERCWVSVKLILCGTSVWTSSR